MAEGDPWPDSAAEGVPDGESDDPLTYFRHFDTGELRIRTPDDFAEQHRRLRKVSRRLLNMRASMALSAWVEAVDMWRMERAAAEHEAALAAVRADFEAQRERAVAQIVSRWQQQGRFRR